MAAVTPLPSNGCKGTLSSGAADIRMKCVKELDEDGNPVFTCSTWRRFRVSCPKINSLCSTRSEAWVAAITVCNQHLY